MGDTYRYRNDTDKLRTFFISLMFSWLSEFFLRVGGFHPRRLMLHSVQMFWHG